ncbi:MAG TPA: 1-deoxy-D-xylulose-5-phosphate synthase [Planctomycetota bacterium]|nr:1-deoxy-D-xylulose-5-phosphate synthase [Planctomycetota bacterium]
MAASPNRMPQIDSPEALRRLPVEALPEVAATMRADLIEAISKTGGHLGSGLGVVEISIALHYVHDFRHDRLVFDVGHQCYPHKMLTGRRERIGTMRQLDGLCGFPHPQESDYDLFHTGHAGTSISLGLGLAVADKAAGSDRRTVVVIGDAGYGAGVAFEAMNHAGEAGVDLLVILNDNEMSISPTVGAMSRYLTRVRTGPLVTGAKRELAEMIRHMPIIGQKLDRSLREGLAMARSLLVQGHVFEEFGFDYFGPMDGHDLARLVHTLQDLKQRPGLKLLHLVTRKGAGCELAAGDPQRLHGVKPNPPGSGLPEKPVGAAPPKRPPFTDVFAERLLQRARQDERIVGITAAMADGTGLQKLAAELPQRCFDVGICEQHAVAFAGGLAKGGRLPVVAIYSTFLQRGYDQLFQELLIQDAPVVLALDRAGLVDDGATHHGLFDIAYLRAMPNTVLMAPSSAEELVAMLDFALQHGGPVALRYPRDAAPAAGGPIEPVELGRAVTLREGRDVSLVAYGTMVPLALGAAERLAARGIEAMVVNARFAKPIDRATLCAAAQAPLLVTLEEHAEAAGFGAAVLEALAAEGRPLPATLVIGVPDRFVEHGARGRLLERLGFTPAALAERIAAALGVPAVETLRQS